MKKKLVLGMSIGCAAILACTTALALSHSNMLRVKAGGNDRTLVFDKDSTITTSGNTLTASEGMMRFYGNYGQTLTDGLYRSYYGSSHFVAIYYDELVGQGYNVYQGFNDATVTSITFVYQTSNGKSASIGWGNLSADRSTVENYGGATTEFTFYGNSSVILTTTITEGDFFDNQANAKSSVYRCIVLRGISEVDIYSVTVNYTCL